MSFRTLLLAILVMGCGSKEEDGPAAAADSATSEPADTTSEVAIEQDTMADTAPPFVPFDINHILSTGQSLSVGAVGSPALSTTQPFSNLMFSKGVIPGGTGLDKFAPLVEAGVETMSSALANEITRNAAMMDHVVLVSAHGVGGTAYVGLKKGTTPYANGIAQLKAAKALADAAKKTYIVRVVTNVHGESDHVARNVKYDADLAQWQSDYEEDVKAITGQTGIIPMLHTQMSSFTHYGQATSTIPQQQLNASRKSGGKIVMVGPKYTATYVADGVHLTNVGYRVMGEYYAKVYRRIVLEGATWMPLQPRTIKREGTTLTVEFDVPKPPLVLDTTIVSDPGSFGFEVVDEGKPTKIASVTLAGPTSVKIVLAAAPVGNVRLRYAFAGDAGPKTGARGNLRDSDDTPSQYTMSKLYNWCVHFDEAVP